MKRYVLSVVGCLVVGLTASLLLAQPPCEEIGVKISPNTLNLKSRGNWVTVHADIPFSEVLGDVYLEGIESAVVKADDCGDLVAKFHLQDVKNIVSTGDVTLKLMGVSVYGSFCGTDTIRVIDKGKK